MVVGCGDLDVGSTSVRVENETTEALITVQVSVATPGGMTRDVVLGPERVRNGRTHLWSGVAEVAAEDRLEVDVEALTLGVREGWLLHPEPMPGEVLELVHYFDVAEGRAALRWRWSPR